MATKGPGSSRSIEDALKKSHQRTPNVLVSALQAEWTRIGFQGVLSAIVMERMPAENKLLNRRFIGLSLAERIVLLASMAIAAVAAYTACQHCIARHADRHAVALLVVSARYSGAQSGGGVF